MRKNGRRVGGKRDKIREKGEVIRSQKLHIILARISQINSTRQEKSFLLLNMRKIKRHEKLDDLELRRKKIPHTGDTNSLD